MELKEILLGLAAKIDKTKDNVLTEEATKTAFIMPFVQALGYNVFDSFEVIPEYTTDIGTKQGEKINAVVNFYQEEAK